MNILSVISASRRRVIYDDDAALLFPLLATAGATVSDAQKLLISDFIAAEKTASRWALGKRFFLPIWGLSAANAIDWVSRTSPSFSGTVTHGAGFAKGNGSSGRLLIGTNAAGLGLSNGNATIGGGIWKEDTRHASGTAACIGGASGSAICRIAPGGASNQNRVISYLCPTNAQRTIMTRSSTSASGIVISTSNAANYRYSYLKRDATTQSVSNTSTDAGTLSANNLEFMSISGGEYTDAEMYFFYLGLGMSASDAAALAASVESLAKALTGKSYTI